MKVLELSKQLGTQVIRISQLDFGFFGGDPAVATVKLAPDVSLFSSKETSSEAAVLFLLLVLSLNMNLVK